MRSAARLQQDDGLIFRITVPPSPSVGVTLHGFSHRTSLSRSCINLKCQLSLTKTYVLLWAAEQKLMIYSAGKAQLSRSTCKRPDLGNNTVDLLSRRKSKQSYKISAQKYSCIHWETRAMYVDDVDDDELVAGGENRKTAGLPRT